MNTKHTTRSLFSTKRAAVLASIIVVALLFIASIVIIQSKEFAFSRTTPQTALPAPFPVSVNPIAKHIADVPLVNSPANKTIENEGSRLLYISWLKRAVRSFAQYDWYQNLASPSSRILVIEQGERREQIVNNFGDILKWNERERTTFEGLVVDEYPALGEGKFFPGHYLVNRSASPEDVAALVNKRFENEVLLRYNDDVARLVPFGTALTLASLLEREAYSYEDMEHIAGIIWNRLFIDMPLQIDATLQYAKGTNSWQPWWPQVHPNDKFIDSVYNTYKHKGLPPAPIANPSVDALLAALNPKNTECLFYFHNASGDFFCSVTYEEHVENLKREYGQGR